MGRGTNAAHAWVVLSRQTAAGTRCKHATAATHPAPSVPQGTSVRSATDGTQRLFGGAPAPRPLRQPRKQTSGTEPCATPSSQSHKGAISPPGPPPGWRPTIARDVDARTWSMLRRAPMVSRPSCPALERGRAGGAGRVCRGVGRPPRGVGCRPTDSAASCGRSYSQRRVYVFRGLTRRRRAPVSTAPAAARGLALSKGGGLVLCPAAEISDGQHGGNGGRCGACLRAPSDQPTMPRHSIQTSARASRDDNRVVAQCAPTGAGVGIALCARGACQKKGARREGRIWTHISAWVVQQSRGVNMAVVLPRASRHAMASRTGYC